MRLFGGKPYCGNPSGNDHVGIVIAPTPERLEHLLKELAAQPARTHSLPAREFALAHFGKSQAAPFLMAYKSL